MRPPPSLSYLDGCTFGPKRFGGIDHTDICHQHDLDWWYGRKGTDKIKADWRWMVGIFGRHWKNTPYQPFAAVYALIGYTWLMTGGWFFWKRPRK